jgi:cold shock CspA family protein
MNDDQQIQTGRVVKILPNGSLFLLPDGAPDDRTQTVFCHPMALQRSGVGELRMGDCVSFHTRPPRFKNGRPEAHDIVLIAA